MSANTSYDEGKQNPDETAFMPLQEVFQPLLNVMRVFGLYHEVVPKSKVFPEDSDGNVQKDYTGLRNAGKIYCFAITLFLMVNVVRCIPAFFEDSKHELDLTVLRVIMCGWYFNCFMNCLIMFTSCRNSTHLQGFFNFYNKISTDEIARSLKLDSHCRTFQRRIYIGAVVVVILSVLNNGGLSYMIISDTSSWASEAVIRPFPVHTITTIAIIVVSLFCYASWIFPIFFIVALCNVLRYQMNSVKKVFENLIKTKGKHAIHKVNDIRLKHLQFTKAVSMLDKDFQYLFAEIFVTGLWISCFTLYQIINTNTMLTYQLIIYAFWLTANIIVVLSIAIAAARVHEEAHSPLENIYDLDIGDLDVVQAGYVNLFITRLIGPSIGFTTMGLITITYELILSLAGAYVTYFFLLFQFKV